jgi:hypothetical protein
MRSVTPEAATPMPGTHKISQGAALTSESPIDGATIIDWGDTAAMMTLYVPGELT